MYRTVTAAQLRSEISQCLNHVLIKQERFLIVRNGRDTAALVTLKDLEALENVERNREMFLEARHDKMMREWRMLKDGVT